MDSYEATFPLDPNLFPYTKATVTQLRDARKRLENTLFIDLVLTEVAQIKNPAKLYPPRSSADLRALHDAIERCPVDLLKKQCCIYYVLRDWSGVYEAYANRQYIPTTYRALMDSYWHLDRGDADAAFHSLCSPGLTPNFASKILQALATLDRPDLVVLLVQTLDIKLDSDDKLTLYLESLAKIDLTAALFHTRRLSSSDGQRRRFFELVVTLAIANKAGQRVVADFPFDAEVETAWLDAILPTLGEAAVETLAVRQTWLGRMTDAYRLRDRYGVGSHALKAQLFDSCLEIEQKQLRMG